MDVNGLRFWQVADARGFGLEDGRASGLHWRSDLALLRLDKQQPAPAIAEDRDFAEAQARKPSPVSDPGGSWAWWDAATQTLRAAGFGAGTIPIALPPDIPPGLPEPTDLAFGADDILYVARNGGIVMTDRRERWRPARVELAGFAAHRLAPAARGGVWALDRTGGQLALLTGQPLRIAGFHERPEDRFRPVEPNPRAPRLRAIGGARLPASARGIALAGSRQGRVCLLAWAADGGAAALFTLEGKTLARRFALEGVRFPYALAWIGEDRVAVIAGDGAAPARQALVYELDTPPGAEASARPSGEVHRLIEPWHGGFCNRLGDVPEYPVAGPDAATPSSLRRLRPLSRASYARGGRATLGPFDSGKPGCVWHRLYVEASIGEHAGLRVWAHASDTGSAPSAPGDPGAPHWALHFAGVPPSGAHPHAPALSWCDEPSEMPFAPGLLRCPRAPGKAGLFTALLQHSGRKVRRIEGRRLWLHLELAGDSLVSPEIAAVRVYADRFSYRDRYLPAFYREILAGPDADAQGTATPHDFLDRFLGLFEGPLTKLEGKVAASWLLTDTAAAPDAALPWLGQWIGLEPETSSGALRQRLRAAPWTARLHGTLGGLKAALELATGGQFIGGGRIDPHRPVPRPGQLAHASIEDTATRVLVLGVSDPRGGQGTAVLAGGAVTRGEIVVVEGWRLRRTFATILGADLADEDDPLTLGLAQSGNSYVGDTLILGDEARREFMALFAADLPQSAADRAAVAAFFERLAFRVLILVRETARTADRARLADVAAAEAPAHVETTLIAARQPLIVGAASLVGIDSFLLPEPPPERVRLGKSRIGGGDRIEGEGQLDPRADGPVAARPVAVADGPAGVFAGTDFLLSATRSEAAAGRSVARHIWTWT